MEEPVSYESEWDKWNPNYIYRLLTRLIGEDHVKWWMNQSNNELDGRSPNDLIEEGRERVVLELIVDMITGAPA